MTSPFTPTGDKDLREYIASAWTQLALVDDTNTIEAVLDIPSDSRVSWTDPTTNPIEARAEMSGDDSDIDAPVEFSGTALYLSGAAVSAGDALADTTPVHDDSFANSDGLFLGANQTATLIHEIQQPQS